MKYTKPKPKPFIRNLMKEKDEREITEAEERFEMYIELLYEIYNDIIEEQGGIGFDGLIEKGVP